MSHAQSSPDEVAMKHGILHKDLGFGDIVSPEDPRSPMCWPFHRKIHASLSAWLFTFALLNSLTSYAAGIMPVTMVFGVGMLKATLGFSLFLFGVMFAPLFTPHVSERIGRTYIYFVCTIAMSAFLLGAAFSVTFTSLAVCRFFAGLCGGPIVVNIEGTFADLWSPRHTVTYYSFLAAAQYLGASCGPIILGPVLGATNDWRYTQFVPLMFSLLALAVGVGMPETYPREIVRREARRHGVKHSLSPALSGDTYGKMAKYTLINPVIMIVTEPIVIGSALLVGTSFAVIFGVFTAVPTVLNMLYSFQPYTLGLAFLSGLAGTIAGAISSIALEQLLRPLHERRSGMSTQVLPDIEYRLTPAIMGSLLMLASLFWIGWTASPTMAPIVPITGTAVFAWGSIQVIIGTISYFFDAYHSAPSILSALTAMAVFRIFAGGITSLYMLTGIMHIQGKWMFSVFGFIMVPLVFWPVMLYIFGAKLRNKSRWVGVEQKGSPMSIETEMINNRTSRA